MIDLAILVYSTGTVVINRIPEDVIEEKYDGDIEAFIANECGFSLDDISWMSGENLSLRVDGWEDD